SRLRKPRLQAQRFSSLCADWCDTVSRACLHQLLPCHDECICREHDLDVHLAGFLCADQQRLLSGNFLSEEIKWLENTQVLPECRCDHLRSMWAAEQQNSPRVGTVLHLGFGAVEQKLA